MHFSAHALHRLVAEFADGTRETFDGASEATARARMEAAQAVHGDIVWYDGVTDTLYDHGLFHAARPATPKITVIDLSED